MLHHLEIDELLGPIDEMSPAGDDMRYSTCYQEIIEARRSEDGVALGEWRHPVKPSEWERVIELTVSALRTTTKDLQVAAWLVEALTVVDGFSGLERGMRLMRGLMERFWESIHPLALDGDLDYRAAPFQFLNDKVALQVGQIPVTDPGVTPGYTTLQWHESRAVGYDAETRNSYGDSDYEKKRLRDERVAEGAVTPEEFDAAAERSRGGFGEALAESVAGAGESVDGLVALVQGKFGAAAPSLAGLVESIGACGRLVQRFYGAADEPEAGEREPSSIGEETMAPVVVVTGLSSFPVAPPVEECDELASSLWGEAVAMLAEGRLNDALGRLLETSNSAGSIRDRNRVRLLMVKLCLKAGRADLARPIVEELHEVIQELHLERWESPVWIAEVLDAYYQCLQEGGLPDDDLTLSRALFRRICSLDVTKATLYRN